MKYRVLLVGALAVACTDAAKKDYENCLDLESRGRHEAAMDACTLAVSIDANSKSGKAAQAKLADIGIRMIDDKAKAEKEAATATAQAAAAVVAACKSGKWTTFCTIDGRPSGGLLKPSALAKCEEDAKGFESMGMACAPCKCADDVEGAIVK